VLNPTTPGNIFMPASPGEAHWRKPLVVMTPKSLLRHPKVVSSLDDCASGFFQRIVRIESPQASNVKRVLLCRARFTTTWKNSARKQSGSVGHYWLEQLYPLRQPELESIVSNIKRHTVIWVQEERKTWAHGAICLRGLGRTCWKIDYTGFIGRLPPARSVGQQHKREQLELVKQQ